MTDPTTPQPQTAERVLVCGGRHYTDHERVSEVLSRLDFAELAHGGAPGADALAAWFAVANGKVARQFAADWKAHGKAAGPIRNQRMLAQFKPDLVVAFPGGRGTAHMVRIAREAGVDVMEVAS